MDEVYHNCQWCKWFRSNQCLNDEVFEQRPKIALFPFWEEGHLSEAIQESFTPVKFKRLEQALLDSKLSQKRVKEIMQIVGGEIENAFNHWTQSIDDSVATALANYDFGGEDNVIIKNPNNFYCKFFN